MASVPLALPSYSCLAAVEISSKRLNVIVMTQYDIIHCKPKSDIPFNYVNLMSYRLQTTTYL